MTNIIGCLLAFALALLLSNVDFIGIKEAKILTYLGWCIALYITFYNYFLKGGL